jgi:hypothetical protein
MTGFSIERLFERVVVAASGCALIGAAAVLDDRVRDRATGVFAGSALSELTAGRHQVERALQYAASTIGYQSSEHGMLMFFAVAAAVLFVVMLRT